MGSSISGNVTSTFSTIAVSGQSDIVADSGADTLTMVGSGVTLTTNASTDTLTITGSSSPTIGDTQVAYATAANTLGGDAGLVYTHPSALSRIVTLKEAAVNSNVQFSAVDNGDLTGAAVLRVTGVGGAVGTFLSVLNGSVAGTVATLQGEGTLSLFTKDATKGIDAWDAEGNTLRFALLPAGQIMTGVVTAPDDSALSASQLAFWFTNTDGAPALVVKCKTADGTVVSGSLNLVGVGTLKASTYKSSDGSSGVSVGPLTAITGITVKNGLVVALSGT